MQQPLILTVDDDVTMLTLLDRTLSGWGYLVRSATNADELWQATQADVPAVVLLDIDLDGSDGMSLLQPLQERLPDTPVIMVTGNAQVEIAVQCIKAGAFDYVTKPLDRDRLRIEIEKALSQYRLRSRVRALESPADRDTYHGMIGSSSAIQEVYRLIDCVGPTDATALILGETGVGKEVAAAALHAVSARSKGPFVPVNCAAIPAELTESALFGHVKGAFTGAHRDHAGFCEQADGGTLFLDEIGEMDYNLQAKLLRFLQDRKVPRVGGTSATPVDVRIVAATNRDPQQEIAEKRLREDLYYRLNVVCLQLPPLRERRGDVALLARHFAGIAAERYGRPAPNLDAGLIARLEDHAWPGNVRELQHLVEQIVVMHGEGVLTTAALPASFGEAAAGIGATPGFAPQSPGTPRRVRGTLAEMERAALEDALQEHGWDVPMAARQLGISEATVYRKIKKFGLQRPQNEAAQTVD